MKPRLSMVTIASVATLGAGLFLAPAGRADEPRHIVYVGPSASGTYRTYYRDDAGRLQPTGQVVYLRRVVRSGDSSPTVYTSSHRLGTARHRRYSASGLGAGGFLIGGPVGWGVYRAVDIWQHR